MNNILCTTLNEANVTSSNLSSYSFVWTYKKKKEKKWQLTLGLYFLLIQIKFKNLNDLLFFFWRNSYKITNLLKEIGDGPQPPFYEGMVTCDWSIKADCDDLH